LPDQERKFEATGTIVDPSGLVVVALSTIDPAKEISGREFNTQQGRVKIDATATLKEVKIILPDGVEVPADVVMKDIDLDLAFVRPKADSKEGKTATYKALDLKNGVAADIADDTVTVWRMEDVMNHKPGVMGGQVLALTQKPRTFVRVSNAILGCPTFSMDGKLIGIGVVRSAKDKAPVIVVLPSADILEVAEQAKAAKPAPEADPKPAATQKAE
jgi:S1-C subfamily serine protease